MTHNPLNDKIDQCLAQFKKHPTPKKLGELVTLLTEILAPSVQPSKRRKHGIAIKDKSGQCLVMDEHKQRWYELFEEVKVDKRHQKAFDIIVEYFTLLGITCDQVKRKNKDIVVFILDWEKHKEDGQAGLFLRHHTDRWELGSLDHKKQLTGMWEISQADEDPSYAFDLMMSENYPWHLAYPTEEEE